MGELFAIVKEMFEENMVAYIKIISRTSLVFFPPHTIIHQILVIATLLTRSLSQWCFGELNDVTLADCFVILLLFMTPWWQIAYNMGIAWQQLDDSL